MFSTNYLKFKNRHRQLALAALSLFASNTKPNKLKIISFIRRIIGENRTESDEVHLRTELIS